MNAKEYLSQASRMNRLIIQKQEQLDRLRAIATKTTTNLHTVVVSGSGSKSKLEAVMEKIILLEEEINNEIDTYVDTMADINRTLVSIEDPDERLILDYRYLSGMPWDEIADVMCASVSSVYMKHRSALKKVEGMIGGS
jgi:Protein of unknown function (DUF1492).